MPEGVCSQVAFQEINLFLSLLIYYLGKYFQVNLWILTFYNFLKKISCISLESTYNNNQFIDILSVGSKGWDPERYPE